MAHIVLAVGSLDESSRQAIKEASGSVSTVAMPIIPGAESLPALTLVVLAAERAGVDRIAEGMYDITLFIDAQTEVYLRLDQEANVYESSIVLIDRIVYKEKSA